MRTRVFSETDTSDCTHAPEAEMFSRTTVSLRSRREASDQRSTTRCEHRNRGSARCSDMTEVRLTNCIKTKRARRYLLTVPQSGERGAREKRSAAAHISTEGLVAKTQSAPGRD